MNHPKSSRIGYRLGLGTHKDTWVTVRIHFVSADFGERTIFSWPMLGKNVGYQFKSWQGTPHAAHGRPFT